MIKKFLLTVLLILTLSVVQVFASVDNLKFKGFIADEVGIFDKAAIEQMNKTFQDLKRKTGASVAIVVLKSASGEELDSIGSKIIETYQIGDAKKGNGIVFILAHKEQLLHVVLGHWFIGGISQEQIGTLLKAEVIPYLREGQFDKGLMRGGFLLADLAANFDDSEVVISGSVPAYDANADKKTWAWISLLVFLAFAGSIGYYCLSKKSNSDEQPLT